MANLRIGATLDTAQLKAGFADSDSLVRQNADSMGLSYQQLATRAEAANRKILADTVAAAQGVSAEWRAAAVATAGYNRALEQVRATSQLVKLTGGEQASTLQALAAAEQALSIKTAERAAALKIATGAEEQAIVATWALTAAEEAMNVATGALGILALFEGLKELAKGAQESAVGIVHLSEKTGISIKTVAGLKFMAESTGVSMEQLSKAMVGLGVNQQAAALGGKAQAEALRGIGLETRDIQTLSPEDYFFKVAEAMGSAESSSAKLYAAKKLLTKAGADLIPMFDEYNGKMRETAEIHGRLAGMTEGSAAASKSFERSSAVLAEVWRGSTIPSIAAGASAMKGLALAVGTATAEIHALYLISQASSSGLLDIAGLKEDQEQVKKLWELVNEPLKATKVGKEGEDDKPRVDAAEKTDNGLAKFQAELDKKKEAADEYHQLSLADEVAFWEHVRDTQTLSAKQSEELLHKLAEMHVRVAHEKLQAELAAQDGIIAAQKRGTAAYVAEEQRKLDILKQHSLEGTREYIDQQNKVAAAQRAMTDEANREAVRAEEEKITALRKGSQERLNEERTLLTLVTKLYGQESAEYKSALDKMTQETRDFHSQQKQLAEEEIRHEEAMAALQVDAAKLAAQGKIAEGLKTTKQIAQEETSFENQIYAIKAKGLQDRLKLVQKDPDLNPTERKKLLHQIEELEQQHNNRLLQIDKKLSQDREKLSKTLANTLHNDFARGLAGMITGTQSFADTVRSLYGNLVQDLANYAVQMGENWIKQHLLMQAASEVSARTEATAKILTNAAVAESGTFAWWSGVDPPVAPSMAGIAYAQGLSYLGEVYHSGGPVGGYGERAAMIMGGEYVINEAAAARSRPALDYINRGGSIHQLPGFLSNLSGAPGGSGDTHLHMNISVSVGAVDMEGAERLQSKMSKGISDQVMARMQRHIRTKGVFK